MLYSIDKEIPYFLLNGSIFHSNEFNASRFTDTKIIYEVIRVVGSKPIFLEEHLIRMMNSCTLSGLKNIDFDQLRYSLIEFFSAHPVVEKNIKISICYNPASMAIDILAHYIESHYPSQEKYLNGVRVELLYATRTNPNVKLENLKLRGEAEEVICISQTNEVLLVDEQGFITEGSRTNFFALKDGVLMTAPSSDVLKGITREKVITLCNQNHINLLERKVHVSEVHRLSGAFITGTSSKILPINRIGDIEISINEPTLKRLIQLFDEMMQKEIIG